MFIELTPYPAEPNKKLLVNLANVAYFKTGGTPDDSYTWVVYVGLSDYDVKVKESIHRIQDLLTAKGYNK